MNNEMLMSLIRHILTLGAGYMVSKGYMRGEYMDTLVSSITGLAVVGWGMASKMKPTGLQVPATSPNVPATPGAPSAGLKGVAGAVFALGLLLTVAPALAEGIAAKQPRQWAGVTLDPPTPSLTGSFYLSVLGSYTSLDMGEGDNLNQWRAGVGLGYLAKLGKIGFGFDVDAMRHFDSNMQFSNELDNWNFSARARMGYFLTPQIMPYVSTGWARIFTEDTWTYGLGVELFSTEKMSFKVEATKYEVSDDLLDIKVGVSFRF